MDDIEEMVERAVDLAFEDDKFYFKCYDYLKNSKATRALKSRNVTEVASTSKARLSPVNPDTTTEIAIRANQKGLHCL